MASKMSEALLSELQEALTKAAACTCSHTHPPSVPSSPCPVEGQEMKLGLEEPMQKYDSSFDHKGVTIHIHKTDSGYCADYRGVGRVVKGVFGDVACAPTKARAATMARRAIDVLVKSHAAAAEKIVSVAYAKEAPRDLKALARGRKVGPLDTPHKAASMFKPKLDHERQEVFLVMPVNLHGESMGVFEVARGQKDRVAVEPSDVLEHPIREKASGFFVAHNHPSTHAKPSPADKDLTSAIRKAAAAACPTCPLLDSFVICPGEFYSLEDGKLYKF